MNEMEKEIEEITENGLAYFLEYNTSIKSNVKKVVLDAYKAGMEAARKIFRP